MPILTLSEVLEFKTMIKNQFHVEIHFHDCCGGQSFSVDQADETLKAFIISFFAEKNLNVIFSENEMQFLVKEKFSC